MKPRSGLLAAGVLAACGLGAMTAIADRDRDDDRGGRGDRYFERIATFPVFLNTDVDLETVSEIVAASEDGKTLIYTDSAQELIGFVDISDPANPQPAGTVAVGGEPTSVAVAKGYALVAVVIPPVDPDPDDDVEPDPFKNPGGELRVIRMSDQCLVATFDLGGQPDAVAVSPNQRFAAIAIENERNEDEGDGRPGQEGNPPGKLVIIDLKGNRPHRWRSRDVSLLGISDKFPNDPEPEFVDINRRNIAVVTMQEDNHLVLVHLPSGRIINDFPAGTVDLDLIDATEDDLIQFEESLTDIPREPDAVAWISNTEFATADEGDLDGGSRGFTIFDTRGRVKYTSGNNDDQLVGSLGHYPEGRSENKGNEPEGVRYAEYGDDRFLFVGSERSSVVSVYSLDRRSRPELRQVLPAGIGPEGLLAIPQRNLFVAASENDERGAGFRATISIYKLTSRPPSYPTVVSLDRPDGTPIPWGALSALAADPFDADRAWTVYDSFYKESRIFAVDLSGFPAYITEDIVLHDDLGAFAAVLPDPLPEPEPDPEDGEVETEEPEGPEFPEFDPAALRNEDGTVNLDPEGLAVRADGGFWLASEGNGTIGDPARPIRSRNWLLRIDSTGLIEEVVNLPDDTSARQRRFGLEGVAAVGSGEDEVVFVAFQREWGVDGETDLGGDPAGKVRIGRYDVSAGEWTFYYYELDAVESPNGGWVGLSEIVALDADTLLVLERDNQGGTDAAVKRIYAISTAGLTPLPEAPVGTVPEFPVVTKVLVRDILPDLAAPKGAVIEKVEGLTVLADGNLLIVTDNDGVDDSNGETQLINLGEGVSEEEEEGDDDGDDDHDDDDDDDRSEKPRSRDR